ncbi:HAMP domain-containing protein [Flexivirga oryzae]
MTHLVSWAVAGRVLEPVRWMRQTADEISESDLDRRIPVRGHNDEARLARTFNHMLDRLQASFVAHGAPSTTRRTSCERRSRWSADTRNSWVTTRLSSRRPRHWCSTNWTGCGASSTIWWISRDPNARTFSPSGVDLTDLTVDVLTTVRVMADHQWVVDAFAEGVVLADGQRLTRR